MVKSVALTNIENNIYNLAKFACSGPFMVTSGSCDYFDEFGNHHMCQCISLSTESEHNFFYVTDNLSEEGAKYLSKKALEYFEGLKGDGGSDERPKPEPHPSAMTDEDIENIIHAYTDKEPSNDLSELDLDKDVLQSLAKIGIETREAAVLYYNQHAGSFVSIVGIGPISNEVLENVLGLGEDD